MPVSTEFVCVCVDERNGETENKLKQLNTASEWAND